MIIRKLRESDIEDLRKFVNDNKPLELHTPFTYWVLSKYFKNTCLVMEDNEMIIGFATGFKSNSEEDTFYIWQIGISDENRGKNYASLLLDNMFKIAKELDCKRIQFSVAPDNNSSYKAFHKFASKNSLSLKDIGDVKYEDYLTDKKEFENLYEIEIRFTQKFYILYRKEKFRPRSHS